MIGTDDRAQILNEIHPLVSFARRAFAARLNGLR
jgi:hypothetical protein